MLVYKASQILDMAAQVADLKNSAIIPHEEKVRVLNECFYEMYQKCISCGDKTWLKTMTLGAVQGGVDGYALPLPDDFLQLESVTLKNTGQAVLRRAGTETPHAPRYEIVNNTIVFYGSIADSVLIKYFPVPPTLYAPEVAQGDEVGAPDFAAAGTVALGGGVYGGAAYEAHEGGADEQGEYVAPFGTITLTLNDKDGYIGTSVGYGQVVLPAPYYAKGREVTLFTGGRTAAVEYFEDVYVAISGEGLWWSADGVAWTQSNVTAGTFYAAPVYAAGLWVAGSYGEGIYYSADGKTWTQSNVTAGEFNGVAFANEIWQAFGNGIYYSADGKTWEQSNVTEGEFNGVAFANEIWQALRESGGIYYSENGITWTQSNITEGEFNAPVYAAGLWQAASSGTDGIYYSADGKTWTQSNIKNSGYQAPPVYAAGLWQAASYNSGDGIYYSENGITWEQSNITAGTFYAAPVYADGLWVAGSYGGGIYYSAGGKTWERSNITEVNFNLIAYAGGLWEAVSESAGIYYSEDGMTWTQSNLVEGTFLSLVNVAGLWILCAEGIYYSADGKTWTQSNLAVGALLSSESYAPAARRSAVLYDIPLMKHYAVTDGSFRCFFDDGAGRIIAVAQGEGQDDAPTFYYVDGAVAADKLVSKWTAAVADWRDVVEGSCAVVSDSLVSYLTASGTLDGGTAIMVKQGAGYAAAIDIAQEDAQPIRVYDIAGQAAYGTAAGFTVLTENTYNYAPYVDDDVSAFYGVMDGGEYCVADAYGGSPVLRVYQADTELSYPNALFYPCLEYMMAVRYKMKQGDNQGMQDIGIVTQERLNAFYESIPRDAFSQARINNFYGGAYL